MPFLKPILLTLVLFVFTNCSMLGTASDALRNFVPDIYEYKNRKDVHFLTIKASETPFKFTEGKHENPLEGKMLKIAEIPNELIEDILANSPGSQAFILIRNDSILYEKYYNEGGKEVQSNIFSITKSWMASLVAIAIEEGKLSLKDPIKKYLPELSDSVENILVEDLLNMRSGLKYKEFKSNLTPFGRQPQAYYNSDVYAYTLKSTKSEAKPNLYFKYQSSNTQLLGMVLEKALERNVIDYFEEKLARPLGLESDMIWLTDEKKNLKMYCCLNATGRDLAKLGRLLLNQGKWNGKQLLPKWFMKSIMEGGTVENSYHYKYSFRYNRELIPVLDNKDLSLPIFDIKGKKFAAKPFSDMDFYAEGFKGNFIYIHPESNTIIVRLSGFSTFLGYNTTNWPQVFRAIVKDQKSIDNKHIFDVMIKRSAKK